MTDRHTDCLVTTEYVYPETQRSSLGTLKLTFSNTMLAYSTLHYDDVIMSTMASQITSLTIVYSTVYFQAQIKENTKAPRHWPLCGEFTGEFPAQMTSNAENVSIWWRHHVCVPHSSRISIITHYNMTVWILAGNYISFTIAAGLIRLYSIRVPGWVLKCLNLITAPGSVSNQPGSVTWLATAGISKIHAVSWRNHIENQTTKGAQNM